MVAFVETHQDSRNRISLMFSGAIPFTFLVTKLLVTKL